MHHDHKVTNDTDPRAVLTRALAHAAHLLPAQAPLARFVHHNTLHAFEHLPFREAVREAARLSGAEPYLAETAYEDALARGRITPEDLEAVLATRLEAEVEAKVEAQVDARAPRARLPDRRTLARLRLSAPVPHAAGDGVDWLFAEEDLSRAIRPEVSQDARRRLLEGLADSPESRHTVLTALYARCLALAEEATVAPTAGPRLRDRLLARTGLDTDERLEPFVVRFVAAYLDQGVAYWPMPERDGLFSTFVRLYAHAVAPPWAVGLERELEAARGRDGLTQALHEYEVRRLPIARYQGHVLATLDALRGWAGMVHQLAEHPDLAPVVAPPLSLTDLLAIRLLLERLALLATAREAGLRYRTFDELVTDLRAESPPRPDARGFALELFVMAQRAGLGPEVLARRSLARAFTREVRALDAHARRALYHLAYERHFRLEALDAIEARARARVSDPRAPKAQLLFCIDEREESFRRHLEEVDPHVATYGCMGHFGVLMRFEGHDAPYPVPLCPPVITPRHRVREIPIGATDVQRRHALGALGHRRNIASKTLVRGGLVALTGVASAIPLVARTLFPGWADRFARASRGAVLKETCTLLELTRADDQGLGEDGLFDGYTLSEQADIVEGLLRTIGLTRDFAELVVAVAHGSSSVNNPHSAAYNCGACAGGKGGPNARAFAIMANTDEVRAILRARGIALEDTTRVVAAQHDTATDDLEWYDADLLSPRHLALLEELQESLTEAGARDAHERCRRFPDAPRGMTPDAAHRHARARTVDLAQPRPEYCHATNALAVIGRRSLTRGLFLDRRAFLVSYDASADDAEGHTLERLLAQVAPVGAGINLEYYFSHVDPDRHGSGTKLPHNVTGLLGVMNGHGGDLRTGLHQQTVEIHEPMRLLVTVEAKAEVLVAIAQRNAVVGQLVSNAWILLAAVDPVTGRASFFDGAGFVREAPARKVGCVASSMTHYRGRSEHLPFVLVDGEAEAREQVMA